MPLFRLAQISNPHLARRLPKLTENFHRVSEHIDATRPDLVIDTGDLADINLSNKMDGWEVAKHAREIDPTFPVVYMSGTHAEDWASKGVPNSVMLAKPFAPAQLVRPLRSF